MQNEIRNIIPNDLNALKQVLDSSQLFPSEMLDDMIADYFTNEASKDIWLTKVENNTPVAIAYCAPERMTEGTYNLYAIAVDKNLQGKGVGRAMMEYLESLLRQKGHRILLVETSSLPEYDLTRQFYYKCNYEKEAVIRDFYQAGEDKIVFRKQL